MIIEITSTICYSSLATSSLFLAPSVLLKLFLCRKIGTFYIVVILLPRLFSIICLKKKITGEGLRFKCTQLYLLQ